MKVSDILRIKGNALYTITPEHSLVDAAGVMAEKDIGSLVVISYGRVVGMLTFREVIAAAVKNGGSFGTTSVYRTMDPGPLICMPVMDKGMLMGVISFYDVAKTVVDTQNFENKLLKAYIRDWPAQEDGAVPDKA